LSETTTTPTPRELAILKVLWEQGPSSVRGVHLRLQAREPGLAQNTVQTMLRVMEEKGLVGHELDGRSFIYSARLTRDENAARFLDRVFDGAALPLVQSLLRAERISPEELDQIQALIAAERKRDRKAQSER
jgi:predicted transcriptional regulator